MNMLKKYIRILRQIDWPLLLIVGILISVGLTAIYSVDLSQGEQLTYFPTQVTALALGSGILLIAAIMHAMFYRSIARVAYVVGLVLLAGVLFFGQTIRGTTGWFALGPFNFQPAELAKVTLVIALAWLISRYGRRFDTWQFVVASALFTFAYVALILLQPDLGSAAILAGTWFGYLLLTGTKKRYIFSLIGVGILVGIVGWMFIFQPYQKERLYTFLDPSRDPLGAGYNVTQSVIAVGAGQVTGRGLGFGSQSQLRFLPEAQTDFIFSVIAEELGFVGVMILLSLFALLIWRLIFIARQSQDEFAAYLVLGIALLFLIQLVVNVGGATGMLPVTGVTLPFVSYGGSSLLINLLLIGIAESVARSTRRASALV